MKPSSSPFSGSAYCAHRITKACVHPEAAQRRRIGFDGQAQNGGAMPVGRFVSS